MALVMRTSAPILTPGSFQQCRLPPRCPFLASSSILDKLRPSKLLALEQPHINSGGQVVRHAPKFSIGFETRHSSIDSSWALRCINPAARGLGGHDGAEELDEGGAGMTGTV